MAKGKTSVFFCQECGYESAKWMGQCPACKEWNTFVEETVDKKSISSSGKVKKESKAAQVLPLSAVKSEKEERIVTGIAEFDRVLGGGIVRGSLVLVGGDPGIGKSTLLLQVCRELSQKKVPLLYVSGEESLHQINTYIPEYCRRRMDTKSILNSCNKWIYHMVIYPCADILQQRPHSI